MAAPSVSVTSNGVSASSVTVTLGGAPAAGVGLLFIASSDTASTIPAYTPGSGMDPNADLEVVIAKQNVTVGSATVSYQVWARVAGASEASSFTLDMDISRPCALAVHVITPDGGGSYANVADFLDVFDFDTDTAWEPICPSVTTLGTDRAIEYSVTWDEGKSLSAAPAGTTTAYTVDISGHDQHGAKKTQGSAGATGSGAWDISSTTRAVAATFAFKNPEGGSEPDPSEVAISAGATTSFKSASSFAISSAATLLAKSAARFDISAGAATDFDAVTPSSVFAIGGVTATNFVNISPSLATISAGATATFYSIAQSPTPADIAALDVLNNAEIGIFINNGETLQDAMDAVASSIGAYYGFDALGYFRLGRVDVPAGVPVMYIAKPDVLLDLDRKSARDTPVPVWQVKLNYYKNYTTQTSLAGSVTTARRSFLDKEYRSVVAEYAAVKTQFLLADTLEIDTLLINEADAIAEADRLLAIHSVPRSFFEFSVPLSKITPTGLNLGEVIELSYDRFGLEAGALFKTFGIRRELGKNRVRLIVWA